MLSIYRFNDVPAQALPQAGGKGASLARMIQAGYPVPEGLLILATAFQNGQINPAAQAELLGQLNRLRENGHSSRFAVRSSALSEDGAQASFAGDREELHDQGGS